MKQFYLLLLVALSVSCNERGERQIRTPDSVLVSVLVDTTDQRLYVLPPDKMLALYHCTQTPDAACTFRLQAITDKRLNPVCTIRLPSAYETIGASADDPQYRKRTIQTFYKIIKDTVRAFYPRSPHSEMAHSECFQSIATELSYLASSNHTERTLIILSDMRDRSDLFDSYAGSTDPDSVAALFNQSELLPESLQGISVFILFTPRTRTEDEAFSVMSDAYAKVLRQRGVTVTIAANL